MFDFKTPSLYCYAICWNGSPWNYFFLFQRQLSAKRVKNVLARSSQTQNYASQPLIYYSFLSLLEDITRIQACKYHHYIWLDAIVLKARHHIHLLMFLGQSFCKSLFLDLEIYKKGNFINHQVHLLQNKKKIPNTWPCRGMYFKEFQCGPF